MVDIAKRMFNQNWKIDPIVRSLLDTDFYKILMNQFIFKNAKEVTAKFKLINRSKDISLVELISEEELRNQLDQARNLSLSRGEATWLRGNHFYGNEMMFTPDYVRWLEQFALPEYNLTKRNGNYELTFEGLWYEVSLWEIPALSIVSELRSRAILKTMGKFELQVLYARAMTKLWEKIEKLKKLSDLRIADFGTRRRHSFLWQDWCIQAMNEGLGEKFLGTSNCLIAHRRELEAIGTNAHELPMIYSALAVTDSELSKAPYKVLGEWQKQYDGNLRIILPDTYGSESFFKNAPDWLATWTGVRIDSGNPVRGAETALKWWESKGEDTTKKLLIFSDGLDVNAIEMLYARFSASARLSFGWGTLLTNDFRGLGIDLDSNPISIVCKAISANGKPTVKISDDFGKSLGRVSDLNRYKRVFA
ncbi:MAG: nicotinate phosphoribosyltransferase [Rhodobacteraceae bacterium]|nr:MAG: nicotinate phosphoribosyltransferase [Paracoccaceae bacterium]